jgi:hypothetical protein
MSTPAAALPLGRAINVRQLIKPTFVLMTAVLLGGAVASRSPLLMAAAVVPFLFGLLVRPDNATLLFVVCFYMNLPVLASHAGAGSLLGSAVVLLLLAPLVSHIVIGRQPLVFTPAMAVMIGYLCSMVLSGATVAHGSTDTVSEISVFLMEGIVLVTLVVNAIRTPEMMRSVVWMLLAAGATLGAISLWQELTHSYGNTLHGLAQVDSLDNTIDRGGTKGLRPRLAGPIGEKNRYAQILLVLLPFALVLARSEPKRTLRRLAVGMGCLILIGSLLTFSRGAFVAFLLMVIASAVLGFVKLRHLLPIGAAIVALTFVVAPDFIIRMQSLTALGNATSSQSTAADNALRGRATENLAALNVFKAHPVIGVGPGEFFNKYSQEEGNKLDIRFLAHRRHAHSLYLELAADGGIVGLSLFLAIILVTIAQLRRLARLWARRRPDLSDLAQACVLSLIAYLTTGLFLQLSFQRYFWILIALSNALIWMLTRADRNGGDFHPNPVPAR